ncbi:MAG: sulfite exporter TauE/SafE family protein [Desulfobacterales bacterium]|nr:sulfite exporter TauE/SafE family protein [Desulfobacterales bacterium]
MNEYILAALFWSLGGFVNGGAGFGAALIALSMNFQTGMTYRKYADWGRLYPLILGAFPGTFLGVTLMKKLPGEKLKLGMGIFLITYSLWGLFFQGRVKVKVSKYWGLLAGCCSSAIGTSFGMGGPPTIVYTSLTGWSRDQIKAAIGTFFMCAGIIMVTAQTLSGLQSKASVGLALVSIPSSVLGGWLGIRVSRHIGEFSYRRILFTLLAAMGGFILYRAL